MRDAEEEELAGAWHGEAKAARWHTITPPDLLATWRGPGLLSLSTAAAGTDSSPSPTLCSPEATAEGHSSDAKGRPTSSLGPGAPQQEEKKNPWRVSRASKTAQKNLEVTAQAMALTTGKPGGTCTGMGELEGSGTANVQRAVTDGTGSFLAQHTAP